MKALHPCAAKECTELIPTGLFLCEKHWKMLTWTEAVRILCIDTIEHDATWEQKQHLYRRPINKILVDLAARELRAERV